MGRTWRMTVQIGSPPLNRKNTLCQGDVVRVMLSLWCCQGDVVRVMLSGWCCRGNVVRVMLSEWCSRGDVVGMMLSGWCCQGDVVRVMLSGWCCQAMQSGWCCQGDVVRVMLSGWCCQGDVVRVMLSGWCGQGDVYLSDTMDSNEPTSRDLWILLFWSAIYVYGVNNPTRAIVACSIPNFYWENYITETLLSCSCMFHSNHFRTVSNGICIDHAHTIYKQPRQTK